MSFTVTEFYRITTLEKLTNLISLKLLINKQNVVVFLRCLAAKCNSAYCTTRFNLIKRQIQFYVKRHLKNYFFFLFFLLILRVIKSKTVKFFFQFYTFLYIINFHLNFGVVALKNSYDRSILSDVKTNHISSEAARKLYIRLKQQNFVFKNLSTTTTITTTATITKKPHFITTNNLLLVNSNKNQIKQLEWLNKLLKQNFSSKLLKKNNYLTETSTKLLNNSIFTFKAITKFPLILPLINQESILFQIIQQTFLNMLNGQHVNSTLFMQTSKPIINAVFKTTAFVNENKIFSKNLVTTTSDTFSKYLSNDDYLQLDSKNSVLLESSTNYLTNAINPEITYSSSVIVIFIIGIFFSFITTVGNLMVMISIGLDKQLQTISNFFLFSLAVADITIGIISIPLMTYYTAMQYWGIGYVACQFWLIVDYLMSNASVLNLLLISFDRYFSVTRPLTYRPRRTTKKALIMISFTYIISLLIWPPWIIGWPYIEELMSGKITVIEAGTCMVQFLAATGNWASQLATIVTAVAAFYLPVSIMIYLYYRVFCETKRRQRELKSLQAGQMFSPTQFGATSALQSLMLPLVRGMGGRAINQASGSFRVSTYCSQSFGTQGNATPVSASENQQSFNFDIRKQFLPFFASSTISGPALKKYCSGRSVTTELSSETESLDVVQQAENISVSSNNEGTVVPNKSKKVPEIFEEKNCISDTNNKIIIDRSALDQGNNKFRSRSGTNASAVTVIFNGAPLKKKENNDSLNQNNNVVEPESLQIENKNSDPSTQLLRSYKVLIEYCQEEGKRPSVRLSEPIINGDVNTTKTDCVNFFTIQTKKDFSNETLKHETISKNPNEKACVLNNLNNDDLLTNCNKRVTKQSNSVVSTKHGKKLSVLHTMSCDSTLNQNEIRSEIGMSSSLKEEFMRKSEKERRKIDRRQESKAAKTLSAILFAFIVTWTPYNVIVCWESFFPNSIPDFLFIISYYLCYVNSAINPVCYALCNARFRMTYMRIMRCSWSNYNKSSLYRNAYFRRL